MEDKRDLTVEAFWGSNPNTLFTQKTIAKVFNVSEQKLEADRCNGRGLPYLKILGKVLYQKKEVQKYLESQEIKNGKDG